MSEKTFQNDLLDFENFFEKFKTDLKEDLNIRENLTDEEYRDIFKLIIKEYENEFYNDFSEIYIYDYYQALLNNVMDSIINFVQKKQLLNNDGKPEIIEKERALSKNILYLYGFELAEENGELEFISKITHKQIPVNYSATQIITNNDIFFRPPKGDPKLRGPHINYTIEYSVDYWINFQNEILNYIQKFENSHSKDYLEDLKDYRYWLNKYRIFENLLVQKNTLNYLKGGEKNVKN